MLNRTWLRGAPGAPRMQTTALVQSIRQPEKITLGTTGSPDYARAVRQVLDGTTLDLDVCSPAGTFSAPRRR